MTSTHAPLLLVLALLAGTAVGAAVLCLRSKWCGEDG